MTGKSITRTLSLGGRQRKFHENPELYGHPDYPDGRHRDSMVEQPMTFHDVPHSYKKENDTMRLIASLWIKKAWAAAWGDQFACVQEPMSAVLTNRPCPPQAIRFTIKVDDPHKNITLVNNTNDINSFIKEMSEKHNVEYPLSSDTEWLDVSIAWGWAGRLFY